MAGPTLERGKNGEEGVLVSPHPVGSVAVSKTSRAPRCPRLKPRLGPAPEGASRGVSSLTAPSREFTRDSSGPDRDADVTGV